MMRTIGPLVLLLVAAAAFPAVAQTVAPAAASAGAEPTKACMTARKREDKEQRSLAAAIDSIAKDSKGRESCSSKSMCARYDSAISDMEKKKARHEMRLSRFKEEAEKVCKTP